MSTPTTAKPAAFVGVDEMRLHGENLSADKVLAGMMKMELRQCIAPVAHIERVAFHKVKLDGVSVVDDCVRPRVPADIERGRAGAYRRDDVDR